MKKLLFSFIIVAAGMFVVSCGGDKNAETATEAEQTEQVAKEAPAAEAASLADIVAKAKAEGANWSADEWKAQFKTALEAYKTFAVAMNEAQPAELEEISKKYADYPALMKELAGIAKQAEGGKDITDEWIQTTMKELGVPEL